MANPRNVIYKKEWWVIFFILGFFFINYPIIHIFNKNFMVFGYPVLFLYLMVGWLLSIIVILLYAWLSEPDRKQQPPLTSTPTTKIQPVNQHLHQENR